MVLMVWDGLDGFLQFAIMRYLKLNDWQTYRIAFQLSNYVWNIVLSWEWFAKKTIGAQFVESTDSISANLAEGFGRYNRKDKIKFYRYAAGSCKESCDWTAKAHKRELIKDEQFHYILGELDKLPIGINTQIKYTNEKLKE